SVPAPFIIGTPATAVLSLIATVFPASRPSPEPVIDVVTYHALKGLSVGSGRLQARSGVAGGAASQRCSPAPQGGGRPSTKRGRDVRTASGRPSPSRWAMLRRVASSGGSTGIGKP